jgi:hypothetical protein
VGTSMRGGLSAHVLVVRSLKSISAGAGEQKSEARPTAPSRVWLVIGFGGTRPTDFAGGGAGAGGEGRALVCVVLLMITALTQTFSPSAS